MRSRAVAAAGGLTGLAEAVRLHPEDRVLPNGNRSRVRPPSIASKAAFQFLVFP